MAECNRCGGGVPDVPYFVHEGEMARLERANRRLWIAVIILVIALSVSCVCRAVEAGNAPGIDGQQEVCWHGTGGSDTA